MYNETLLNFLNSISDTRGFFMFCLVIAVAYASIWALVLFEAPVKKKKKPVGDEKKEEDEDEEAKPAGKSSPQKRRQAA
ncbi:MAG: hypothetical protein FVQ81_16170 [Candidatus Glassbacteria bacterium]|nr:hypothetical protein [Candidatus Glassbacteria bacterium]